MSQTESWKTRLAHRHRILRMVRDRVSDLVGLDQEIKAYEDAFRRQLPKHFQPSTLARLVEASKKAAVVYASEFHADPASQLSHLHILSVLFKTGRPLVLAVEMIESRFQLAVDRYLSGKTSEKHFLIESKWATHWGFPWGQYRPLFEFAKNHGIRIVAINRFYPRRSLKTLKWRDQHMARVLAAELQRQPGALYYCLAGELHMGNTHLPKEVRRFVGPGLKTLTLFQDLEEEFWRFGPKTSYQEPLVLQDGPSGDFCVLSSSPWIRWFHFLLHLESEVDPRVPFGHHLDLVIREILEFYGSEMGFPTKGDVDVRVVVSQDAEGISDLLKGLEASDRRRLFTRIQKHESFWIPSRETLFLGDASLSALAYGVALIFCSLYWPRERWELDRPRSQAHRARVASMTRVLGALWSQGLVLRPGISAGPRRKSSKKLEIPAA